MKWEGYSANIDLYSKRQKQIGDDVPDVYSYDNIPQALKVQIVHIWRDVLGNEQQYYSHPGYPVNPNAKDTYKFIVDVLCREYGLFKLPTTKESDERMYLTELENHLLTEKEIERQLDVIELSFRAIQRLVRCTRYMGRSNNDDLANKAIDELNIRFQEHGIGFQFVKDKIVQIDSEFIHAEVVKPALRLLSETGYEGAQQEFLSAHEHYRHGRNKEALNDCLKSFESTMKVICDKREWECPPNANVATLIKICLANELISSMWQQQFNSLRGMLVSGIAPARNKMAAHGQGVTPITIPDYLVAYILHMTASNLVFLITAEKNGV